MLYIKEIKKKYVTGELVQTALDGVSLNFRDNEFVAILGPSGSGKTTLLNIIGGLDRYDSGDLVINGVSTKEYTDRDWDTYRNHSIGFIFQSYNLIPHQSVLANVELALTISGISRAERREKAKRALEQVGLGDQLHKKPNQMSGGQMQRVAIARALVNDPDILLADEPTGALDSETGIQVMELLKQVAKDRLVVMVTHNPELAETYANRIVNVRDGKLISDSNPYNTEEETKKAEKPKRKASMSFRTALGLSANNLLTKKGRTLLTSFAGSIGIIGIALILALSSGVNIYIDDLQKNTMASYPITISSSTIDMTSMINVRNDLMGQVQGYDEIDESKLDGVYSDSSLLAAANAVTNAIVENDLTAFKKYIDDPDSKINKYIGENGVVYSYDTKFDVYTKTESGAYLNTSRELSTDDQNSMFSQDSASSNAMLSLFGGVPSSGADNFSEILSGTGDKLISEVVTDSYDLIYGHYPKAYDEVILVLNRKNSIQTNVLCQLGLISEDEYKEICKKIENGEEYSEFSFDFADVCGRSFYLLTNSDYYVEGENGRFKYVGDDTLSVSGIMDRALELKVVGVVRPTSDPATSIATAVAYTSALTDYIIEHTNESAVVKAQEASPDVNVINGMTFVDPADEEKAELAKQSLLAMEIPQKAKLMTMIMSTNPGGQMPSSEAEAAAMLDMWLNRSPDVTTLVKIYDEYFSGGTYESNLTAFGKVSYDAPSFISIYCDSFEAKEGISESIENYNKTVGKEEKITYTDYVALMTESITMIVNVISYVLIAFVTVSLVVSSIMIAIITHISVLERTKEIGILRAIGASKRNISQVFNAETFIIGLCSGIIGVGLSELLIIPINSVIHALADNVSVNAVLSPSNAVILVAISMAVTVLGGLIPAKKAAKKDPVIALRTE